MSIMICDSVQTVLIRNQFLERDDLGTLGQLLRPFGQSFCLKVVWGSSIVRVLVSLNIMSTYLL